MSREQEEYDMEQEMEVEALGAILMDDLEELSADRVEDLRLDEAGISGKCYRVRVEAVEDAEPDAFSPGEAGRRTPGPRRGPGPPRSGSLPRFRRPSRVLERPRARSPRTQSRSH